MIWPPLKAWTCKSSIDGNRHFIAINYGGNKSDRWVILISVIDSNVAVKVSFSELIDQSKWSCGWEDNNYSNLSKILENNGKRMTISIFDLSIDSGLTIPITKGMIRNWFEDI